MMISILPVSPANRPVPESGTTLTLNCGVPRFIVPLCWRMKRSGAAVQRSGHVLDRDIPRRAFDFRHGGEHLALGGSFEIAVVLLIDRHAADRRVGRRLRRQLHLEGSGWHASCRSNLYIACSIGDAADVDPLQVGRADAVRLPPAAECCRISGTAPCRASHADCSPSPPPPTASVHTGFKPAISTPGLTIRTPRIHGPSPPAIVSTPSMIAR